MGTQYTLKFENNSTLSGSVCIYQRNSAQDINKNLYSLAWFSKACHPNTRIAFRWSVDYSFMWSYTGRLVPGVYFDASEMKDTDPANANINSIGFTKGSTEYMFTNTSEKTNSGSLGIYTDDKIRTEEVSIGIGMSKQPAFACTATPNFNFTFMPHPEYWIAFGYFKEGEVIDLNGVWNAQKIVFPVNVYSQTARLREDNTWEIVTY